MPPSSTSSTDVPPDAPLTEVAGQPERDRPVRKPTPDAPPLPGEAVERLADLIRDRRTVVLTGAGVSTESGIPDYRGPGSRGRVRKPMLGPEFEASAGARARYWLRSMAGWRRFAAARPNPAHEALARLEGIGAARGLITQNVDGLHQAGGSREVLELHGSLSRVRCLACGAFESRGALQVRLEALNPGAVDGSGAPAPDGDVELPADAAGSFRVPGCRSCDGILKPDVVFFGDTVPRDRVRAAEAMCDAGDVLLVAGSSLEVFSGRRFVDRVHKAGRPVAVVNLGPTRADRVATLKLEGRAGDVLPRLAAALGGVWAPGASAPGASAPGPSAPPDPQFAAKQ